MIFYLGTHEQSWLGRVDVPLMVSRNRLDRGLPIAVTPWVLDSGGFTELSQHGRWRTTAIEWARDIERISDGVGRLVWAAPQDWMCEPFIVERTGLSVGEHQARTVGNYLELRALGAPVIPVLQGYSLADYEHCVDLYDRAGVDLEAEPTVGLGSVCRRESTNEIAAVVTAMAAHGFRLHGFGCKEGAVRKFGHLLQSADSMAWSFGGRRRGTCVHLKSRCSNHWHWASDWRDSLLASVRMEFPS